MELSAAEIQVMANALEEQLKPHHDLLLDSVKQDIKEISDVSAETAKNFAEFRVDMNEAVRAQKEMLRDQRKGRFDNATDYMRFGSGTRERRELTPLTASVTATIEKMMDMPADFNKTREAFSKLSERITPEHIEDYFYALAERLGHKRPDKVMTALMREAMGETHSNSPRISGIGFKADNGETMSRQTGDKRISQALVDDGGANTSEAWAPRVFIAALWTEVMDDADLIAPYIPNLAMGNRRVEVPSFNVDVHKTYVSPMGQRQGDVRPYQETTVETTELDAHEFMYLEWLSQYFVSDTPIDIAGELMNYIVESARNSYDEIILNSDNNSTATANVNGVDTTAAYVTGDGATGVDARNNRNMLGTGISGIRKYLDSNASTLQITQTPLRDTDILRIRRLLGFVGKRPGSHVYIMPLDEYYRLLAFPLYSRVDAVAQLATTLRGELNEAFRIPLITPRAMPQGMLANGREHATTGNTAGSVIAISPQYWRLGVREACLLYTSPSPRD